MDAIFNAKNYEVYHDIIECLTEALEFRDLYTSGHSQRVAHMSYEIGKEYGLSKKALQRIHIAGHLHDIGKIGVPDGILNKPFGLTEEEYKKIQMHSEIGYKILQKSEQLKHLAKIVLHHHERWDGKGYPNGLKGTEIPIESRIIAVSDAIDAMTSNRAYRDAFSWEYCNNE